MLDCKGKILLGEAGFVNTASLTRSFAIKAIVANLVLPALFFTHVLNTSNVTSKVLKSK